MDKQSIKLIDSVLRAEEDLQMYQLEYLEALFETIFGSENLGKHLLTHYLPEKSLFGLFCALSDGNKSKFADYLADRASYEAKATKLYYDKVLGCVNK